MSLLLQEIWKHVLCVRKFNRNEGIENYITTFFTTLSLKTEFKKFNLRLNIFSIYIRGDLFNRVLNWEATGVRGGGELGLQKNDKINKFILYLQVSVTYFATYISGWK